MSIVWRCGIDHDCNITGIINRAKYRLKPQQHCQSPNLNNTNNMGSATRTTTKRCGIFWLTETILYLSLSNAKRIFYTFMIQVVGFFKSANTIWSNLVLTPWLWRDGNNKQRVCHLFKDEMHIPNLQPLVFGFIN